MTLFLSIALILVGALIAFSIRAKNRPAKELCLICEKELERPIYHNGHALCDSHIEVYKTGRWELLVQGNATSEDPEYGVKIYKLKNLLSQLDMPSHILVDYSLENGSIVTKMKLMTLEENLEKAKALSKSILD